MRKQVDRGFFDYIKQYGKKHNKRWEDPDKYLVDETEKRCLELMREWGGGLEWPFRLPNELKAFPSRIRHLLRNASKGLIGIEIYRGAVKRKEQTLMRTCLQDIQYYNTLISRTGYWVWRGQVAQRGSLSKKRDALSLILLGILEDRFRDTGSFPTYREVLNRLDELSQDHLSVICEVDRLTGAVAWQPEGKSVKDTSLSSIRNRLTHLRKEIQRR
jgi:hypothetical protein